VKFNQKGFTVFEVVLLVLVLAALGLAGYSIYQARQDKVADSGAASSQPKTTQAQSVAGDPEVRVKELYALYLPRATEVIDTEVVTTLRQKGYVIGDLEGHTNLLCSQGVVPKSIETTLVSKSGSEAVVAAVKVYSDGSKEDEITLVMSANSDNQWALKKILCKLSS
jgi:D-serine deaminase-like pyridoxal phosphate-dependent protein